MSFPMMPPGGTGRQMYGAVQGPGYRPTVRGPAVGVRTATDGRDFLRNDPDGWEVDNPELWWEGPEDSEDGTGGPLGNPPWQAGGRPFTRLPAAVTRCTSLISDTLAGMPWQVRRDRERLPTPDWISDPQAKRRDGRIYGGPVPAWRRSAVEFRSWSFTSMLWLGESVWYVPNRNADGSPAPPLWQLHPDYIDVENGSYVTAEVPVNPMLEDEPAAYQPYEFRDDELIVTRGLVRDGIRGIGVLQAHWYDLILSGEIGEFAYNMLKRGVPSGYLKVNAPQLTKGKARQLQADWMRAHGGSRKQIAVLNASTEFHAIGIDPQALQLAQMRDYTTLDIALIFGVPPWFLGLTQARDTYSNVEQRMTELAQFTLLPWSRRMESSCDAELPRTQEMRINLGGLLRGDTLARYQAHKIGLDAEFLTRDEVRDMEDRPPYPVEMAAEEADAAARLLLGPTPEAEALRVMPGGLTP